MENEHIPENLAIIAGKGVYPRLLAESARAQGVRRIFVLAFKGETHRGIERSADETQWVRVGQLERFLAVMRDAGCRDAVMVGQITPTLLFRLRPDRAMIKLLNELPVKNAETIFGAVSDTLASEGIRVLPAARFMENCMPAPGLLGRRAPDEREQKDIDYGMRVAKATSGLDIGQTVVIKDGVILAVEAFEGTDRTLRRAGRLGGPGAVAVKTAKQGHDMRFDIPVVGMKTMRVLKRAGLSALAVEAGRTILLEREKLIFAADEMGLCFFAVDADSSHAPDTRLSRRSLPAKAEHPTPTPRHNTQPTPNH